MPLLEAAGLTIFVVILLVGIFSIIFGLPGTFLILGDVVIYSWITGFEKIGLKIIIVLVFISLLAETMDFFLGIAGARRYGSSKTGVALSIIGGIVGAIMMTPILFGLGAIIGVFLGGFAGAFLGEYLEQRKLKPAIRAGYGSLIGRIIGTLVKGSLAIVMVVIAMSAIYS
ncbi:MAG: DUF456 domain-containing protein [Deltaproteobacteria bacterium]|nr:DUF456 domain-containing protein [Deltaproteobacteria bacterium]MBW2595877.1 DUF456 domain-containing protein [Deltaproteobacteria bacterium]